MIRSNRKPISLMWTAIMVLASCSRLQGQPSPSPKLSSILTRQAERAKQGISDLRPFQADLEPLAISGDATAQFLLATQLLESDQVQAVSWLRKSANGGCAGAAGILGAFLLQSSDPESAKWIHRAAKGGDAASLLLLATFHEKGEHGYQKSIESTLAYLEIALRQSYSKAMSQTISKRIQQLRSSFTPQQLKASETVRIRLNSEFPKVRYYVGGQSLP